MTLSSSRGLAALCAATVVVIAACSTTTSTSTPAPTPAPTPAATPAASPGTAVLGLNTPHVAATSPDSAGEYLTIVGGCNDCHTARWGETNGNVAPADRFTGNPVGYRGPWGTTYAPNLRLVTQRMSEDRWVHILTTAADGKGEPPMPWMNTKQMSDQDLRALYVYIRSLGPKGQQVPRALPPGQTPTGPYVDMTPRNVGAQ